MRLDTSAIIKLLSISLIFYFKLFYCQRDVWNALQCSLLGILFLDSNYWPFLGIFYEFSEKICKINDFTFILKNMFETPKAINKKMFASIFKAYQSALILCCTTIDLGIFYYCSWNFWSCICESPDALQSIMVKCRQKARSEKL